MGFLKCLVEVALSFRAGLYRGWFPVVTSVCCSNFVYFYTFNGLKALAYKGGAKPYPAKDLLLGFVAGKIFHGDFQLCHTYM